MNLLTLGTADLRHQKLASALNVGLMLLGTAMISALLLIADQVERRANRDSAGIDLVVGAKGSPLQLILSSLYHLDVPTGNIPLAEAERIARNPLIAQTIPISLGDNARGYRIVGTEAALLERYQANLIDGRIWQAPMEAVVGADVADAGLKVGDEFAGVHGLAATGHVHADHRYRVVGRLARTGGVVDRLILTSLDSVWEVHGAHHHDEHPSKAVGTTGITEKDDDDDDDGHEEASDPARQITALLVRYRNPLAAATLPRAINTQSDLQAAVPAFEMARLLQLLGIGLDTLRALAFVLVAAATLSVFVAIYTAMERRQYDLAILRSLGASRRQIVLTLWLQALLLAGIGTLLGMLAGHAAVGFLGHVRGAGQGVGLTGLAFPPEEAFLLALPPVVATLAAALPAWRAYRADLAPMLSAG